jgi:hypothetical protein
MVFDRLPEYRQQNQFMDCPALFVFWYVLGEISYGSRDFIDLLYQRVISFRLKYSLVHSPAAFTALHQQDDTVLECQVLLDSLV